MGNFFTNNAKKQRAITDTRTKREQRFEDVRKRVGMQDPSLRDEILSLPLLELRDALQSGKYSASKVLYAYAWKALKVQDELNCICEFLVESFDEAESLDKKYAGDGAVKPPLFGIPFSVKNSFYLKGYDSTTGFAQFLNQPKSEDCTFVTQLRKLGGVPFVSTNVPQSLISYVCSNPVYGTTLNPHNPRRSPGGSSGGEACLLAAGGTPFALGNDLAGSLRIPAIFCGVTSLKPTEDRFIVEGTAPGIPGRGRLSLSHGFFTKTVAEQSFLLGLVLGTEDYKKLILRSAASLPFRKEIVDSTFQATKLRVGYFSNDGFLPSIPACARVVEDTVEKLRAEGFEMVKFDVPHPEVAASCFFRALMPDGGTFFANLFANDIVDDYLKPFPTLLKLPKWLFSIVGYAIRWASPQMAVIARAYVQTAEDVRIANAQLDAYNKEFENYWNELGIDALVCPAFAVAAVEHHHPSKLWACVFITALFSMLDYPAGIVPTGKVTKQDDVDLMDERKWPTGYNVLLRMVKAAGENSAGLPLAVQIVTKPFEEEKCLGVMSVVEKAWRDASTAVTASSK